MIEFSIHQRYSDYSFCGIVVRINKAGGLPLEADLRPIDLVAGLASGAIDQRH